jgi:hypothetical protein
MNSNKMAGSMGTGNWTTEHTEMAHSLHLIRAHRCSLWLVSNEIAPLPYSHPLASIRVDSRLLLKLLAPKSKRTRKKAEKQETKPPNTLKIARSYHPIGGIGGLF